MSTRTTGESHDDCAAAFVDWEQLAHFFADELVHLWHVGDFPLRQPSLAEWMGLTDAQYAAWVEGRWADVLA